MQDANLNSGTPIFKIHILAQFMRNNPLSQAKGFHFTSQTHIEFSSAKMNTPSAADSLLLANVSKITPTSNVNSCEY